VDEELQRFDDHMSHVRGLAPSTRKINLCFIRRLLFGQFGDQAVVISAILPDHIRQFVANQGKLCKVTTSISAPIFRSHGPAWRYAQHDHLSLGQLKVMSAIEQCRTATLGGHLLCCPACDHHEIACNSCRNRLCTSLKN